MGCRDTHARRMEWWGGTAHAQGIKRGTHKHTQVAPVGEAEAVLECMAMCDRVSGWCWQRQVQPLCGREQMRHVWVKHAAEGACMW